jgi:hypothetical protein
MLWSKMLWSKMKARRCEECQTLQHSTRYVEPYEGWLCEECFSSGESDMWEDLDFNHETETTWENLPGNSPTTASSGKALWGYPVAQRHCAHNGTPFTLPGGLKVHLSGSMNRKETKPKPTVAVYLDGSWLRGSILSNSMLGMRWPKQESEPHVVYLSWPDFGVVPVQQLQEVIQWAWEQVREGAILEIGCLGGHGRTGTFVAGMMVENGLPPKEAISRIRSGYCSKAIETWAQEKLLDRLGDISRQ